jgi:hypothetical protein
MIRVEKIMFHADNMSFYPVGASRDYLPKRKHWKLIHLFWFPNIMVRAEKIMFHAAGGF